MALNLPDYMRQQPEGDSSSSSGLTLPSYLSRPKPATAPAEPPNIQRPQPSGLLRRTVGDTAVDLGRGIIGVGEAAVGLANIPTFGYAGKGLEAIGYDPKTTKEMIGELHSPERKAALAEVEQAEGFTGTARAMLRNPSTIAGAVAESAPSILGGGAIARGLSGVRGLAAQAVPRTATAAQASSIAAQNAARNAARAAIGEGAVGAGGAAEGIRQQTEDGTLSGKQVAAALGTGATTALLGYGGGRLAQRLGIGDVDTVLAGAGANGIRRPVPTPGLVRRTLQGAATEGVLEEMPQSVTEQMWQNLALDRPLAEGVPESAAAGMLTGTAIGGPFAALSRPRPTVEPAPDIPDDITGARARALERMTPQQREEMVASDAAPAARPEGNLTDTLRQQQEGQFLADIEAAETPADRAAAEARLAEFRQQVAAFDGEVADGNVVGGSAAPVETTGVGDATAGEAVPGGDPQRDGAGAAVPEGSVPGVRDDLAGAGATGDAQPALSPGQLFPRAAPRLPDGSPVPDPAAGPLSRAVNGGVATGAIPTARTLIPFPGAAPSTASDAVNALAATQPVLSGLARPEPGSAPGTNISRPASELNAVDDAPSEPAGDDGEIVMQNRDRSRVASVGQMRSIRNNPDAERLGFSRDPNTGAPMVGEGRAVPDADKGASDVVVGSDGKRVPVRYAVVEASELAASHDADGRVNPRYAQAPLKALNNGRVAGLQAAWLSGTAQDYRAGIIADARTHGVPEAAISSKKSPVLVRLYDPSTNMGDMGAWSNASAQLGMSPVEQAQTDARSLPPLDSITWSQDGNLIPAANANFFRAWFGNLGGAEAASLQDADGKANALALRRVQAAIVQRAYGDERVLTALAEEVDPDNRNIINALVRAAPSFAALGTNDPLATDIRQRVIEALETVRHADQQGVPLEAALAQADMLGRAPEADAIAQFMGGNKRSVRRMADAFTAMTKYVTTAQSQAATTDIFGDRPKPTIHAALEAANQTLRENYGDQYRIELPSQSDLGIAQPGDRSSEREGWERAASDQAATTETVPDEPGVERPQDQPETLTLATQLGEPDLGQSPPAASQEGLFAPPTRREELEAFDTLFDTIESRTDPETGGEGLRERTQVDHPVGVHRPQRGHRLALDGEQAVRVVLD
ncbi:MAG TPA: hypothetical protein PLY54_05340, partial [Ottowia sp.]|nr:hypothetical protein [Ottowia sp.]